jgi:hypothetical protein
MLPIALGSRGGRAGRRMEAMRAWLEGCKFSDVVLPLIHHKIFSKMKSFSVWAVWPVCVCVYWLCENLSVVWAMHQNKENVGTEAACVAVGQWKESGKLLDSLKATRSTSGPRRQGTEVGSSLASFLKDRKILMYLVYRWAYTYYYRYSLFGWMKETGQFSKTRSMMLCLFSKPCSGFLRTEAWAWQWSTTPYVT